MLVEAMELPSARPPFRAAGAPNLNDVLVLRIALGEIIGKFLPLVLIEHLMQPFKILLWKWKVHVHSKCRLLVRGGMITEYFGIISILSHLYSLLTFGSTIAAHP